MEYIVECLAEIGQASTEVDESEQSKYSQIWKTKNVHLLAGFILVYVGELLPGMLVMRC